MALREVGAVAVDRRRGAQSHRGDRQRGSPRRALAVTVILRRRLRDIYFIAEQKPDGAWTIEISNALSEPVSEEERREILQSVLDELSSLRAQVWRELGKAITPLL